MARISKLKTVANALGLTSLDTTGLDFIEGESKIRVRSMIDGNTISKTIHTSDYSSKKKAIQAGVKFKRIIAAYKKLPNATDTLLIKYGIDPMKCHRGISIMHRNGKSYWRVQEWSGKKGKVNHTRTFVFDEESQTEAKAALKKAMEYREEVMGDILRANPKTGRCSSERIVGTSKRGKMLKGIDYQATKKGYTVFATTSKKHVVGKCDGHWISLYNLMKEAIAFKDDYFGTRTSKRAMEVQVSELRAFHAATMGL